MTAEEIFCDLLDKYGEDFNWCMVPLSQASGFLVEELKKEIGEGHILYHKKYGQLQNAHLLMMFYMLPAGNQGEMFIIFSI